MLRSAIVLTLYVATAPSVPPPPVPPASAPLPRDSPDVIVVGAGPGGLATALEAARGNARVTVVDMASVFGGHAVVAEGGLSFPGTPLQVAQGLADDPDRMFQDMLAIGEDADRRWARLYVDRSVPEVFDWLQAMGVRFHSLGNVHGNSVSRYHLNPQRGFGIVAPIYRACLQTRNIQFVWNTRITRLLVDRGRVVGVEGTHTRSGDGFQLRARSVVLATGGFQSDVALVRKHWPPAIPVPPRLLSGAGVHAAGSGLQLGAQVGAAVSRLDHQWNYPRGIPDPRYPGSDRGLSLNRITFPWINQQGRRFVQERTASHLALAALVRQPGARAWLIFDDDGKSDLEIAGTDWIDRRNIERLILDNPDITLKAGSLAELAVKTGLPAGEVARSIERWNGFIAAGEDPDFGRFSRRAGTFQTPAIRAPRPVRKPPFRAIAIYPVTRKSMGGLVIDLACRVQDGRGRAIPGLFAVGEVTGFGGINGRASLEGTFIAPALLQGRRVGRALGQAAPKRRGDWPPAAEGVTAGDPNPLACATCHPLPQLLALKRKGYWHFDRVHTRVVDDKRDCSQCHAEMAPFRPGAHKIDRVAQVATCTFCHLPPPAGP